MTLELTTAAEWFFDKAAVLDRIGPKRNKALLVIGAFIRRKARDLQRRSKKSAAPGEPPRRHSPEPNLATVLFALDPSTDSLVAGSVGLSNRKLKNASRDTLPGLMEFGGEAEVTERSTDRGETWITVDASRKGEHKGKPYFERRVRKKFRGNPYMSVALERALPTVPAKFRDLI